MLGKPKANYILNSRLIRDKDFELVGREALSAAKLAESKLPVPDSFVLTTICFDDFITASDTVDPISKALKEVRPFIKETASNASKIIANYVLSAEFPNIIATPIKEAYRHLSRAESPLVNIEASHIIDPKYLPKNSLYGMDLNIKGIDDLLYNIKLNWLSLFSTEAIEARTNGYYKGPITMAIIIKKATRAEISGKAYSFAPITHEKNTYEINAIYGLLDDKSILENFSDVYKLDKNSLQIKEKIIAPQNVMLVRKGKSSAKEDPNIRVEISRDWQKKQKLDDSTIKNIANVIKDAEKLYKNPIEISWSIETGQFFITHVEEKLHLTTRKPEAAKIEKIVNELEKNKEDEKVNKPEKKESIDLDTLQKEIRQMVKNNDLEVTNAKEYKHDRKPLSKGEVKEIIDSKFITWNQKYDLITNLYLDISKMTSGVLSAINNFQGSFLDGTEILLSHNFLPEENLKSKDVLNREIESLAQDISNAARVTTPNTLIYQFSDIGDFERKLLGINDSKYYFSGDERFIETPEALAFEAIAVRKSRNIHNNKNINISIPGVRNLNNLHDIKKILSGQNLRSAASLSIYAEVSIPSMIFDLYDLDKHTVDGVIINLNVLLKLSANRISERMTDYKLGYKIIENISNICKENDISFIVKLDTYSEDLLESIIKLVPEGIIFSSIPEESVIRHISEIEKKNIASLNIKKRGRKIKDLF